MKKITLSVLFIFCLSLAGIFSMSLLFPPIDSATTQVIVSNSPLTTTEVAGHNTDADCYLLIKNKVYDVSTYIGKHPGGKSTITNRCGKEVTGIFASIHSNFAWDLLNDYYIGELVSDNSVSTSDTLSQLDSIQKILEDHYLNADIISVKPKDSFYVAKIIYENSLYEIHIDPSGIIISEEVENDEYDWSSWDVDSDDQ